MAGKTYTKGNASVSIDQDMQKLFSSFLSQVLPNASKIMEDNLKKIEHEAQQEWPKRKPRILRNQETGAVVWYKETSKGSYRMFERGTKVDSKGNLVVYLRNNAPYSWAIKFGVDSENYRGQDILQPQGRRAATELMTKPMTRTSRKVVRSLTDDLGRRL